MMTTRITPWLLAALLLATGLQGTGLRGTGLRGAAAADRIDVTHRPLERIPPGTVIGRQVPETWTHMLMFARPRLGAGDVDAAPAMARKYASAFSTVLLARVSKRPDGNFRLATVAVGQTMNIGGKNVVVTADTQGQLGGNLGFLGRRILQASEEALQDVKQVARYDSLLVFDAKGYFHYQDDHHEMQFRTLVWISERDGSLGSAVWLLKPEDMAYRLAYPHFVLLKPGLVEDRVLHVDGSRFTFGVPSEDALAIDKLPPGRKVPFTDGLKGPACCAQFTPLKVQQLAQQFALAVQTAPIQQGERDDNKTAR